MGCYVTYQVPCQPHHGNRAVIGLYSVAKDVQEHLVPMSSEQLKLIQNKHDTSLGSTAYNNKKCQL